jgi:valyl-tRNA synthetase
MLGLYVANGKHVTEPKHIEKTVPFKDVVLHGLVNDPYGKKMSKSKGNVVNPLELVDQYGADAVRFALVYGTGLGNDQAMSYGKLDASKKFANKLWNMARFIEMKRVQSANAQDLAALKKMKLHATDTEWISKIESLIDEVSSYIDNYQFNLAAERLYEFSWHEFADKYIEDVKNRMDETSSTVVSALFAIQLQLLHPFMPFITEEIYTQLGYEGKPLIISKWPSKK